MDLLEGEAPSLAHGLAIPVELQRGAARQRGPADVDGLLHARLRIATGAAVGPERVGLIHRSPGHQPLLEEPVDAERLQALGVVHLGREQVVLAEQRLPLERIDDRLARRLPDLRLDHSVLEELRDRLGDGVVAGARGKGDACARGRRGRPVEGLDVLHLAPARRMMRPVPGRDEEVVGGPRVRRAREREAVRQAVAVRLLERRFDLLAIVLPVQIGLLDGGDQKRRHVDERALGEEPDLPLHLAALECLGDVVVDGRREVVGVGGVLHRPHLASRHQIVRRFVLDVREQDAGGVPLLLAQRLGDLVEVLGGDQLEVDVSRLAELGELVLTHPGDPGRARAEEDARLGAPREVRPRRSEVDEQEPHVDDDAEEDQHVDKDLLSHGAGR